MLNEIKKEPVAEIRDLRRRVAELERQVVGYRQLTERLGQLPKASEPLSRPFFPALVESLANTLNADYVIVGELTNQATVIQATAIYAAGEVRAGDQYALAGTPCEGVVGKRLCTYPARVRELFPTDGSLAAWGVESYVGTPLWDHNGAPLGILCALWKTPLDDPQPAESILSLFAGRAAREIERVRADEALRTSEARFRTLCQASPMGIFEADEAGYCTYISTQWQEFMGRPQEELLGFGWYPAIHPDDLENARAAWSRANDTGRPYLHEFRIVLTTGEVRWARAMARRIGDISTGPAHYVGCIEDVTDRKQAEIAQQAIEERFRAFMDNSPAVAFLKDSQGRRVYANAQYLKLFQVGDDLVLGKTDFDMFDAKLARKLLANDERVLAEGRPIQTIEDVPTADGVLRHWLVYKFPVKATSGEVYVGGVAVDITERRHAEEELRKARDELEKRVAERTSSLTVANTRLQQEVLERESADAALRAEQVLLRRLLYHQEADRKLIAYEIHDGPVQYVTAALMHLETARESLSGLPEFAGLAFSTALTLLRDTIQEARRMISGLQPIVLDESGLVAAIECLIADHFDRNVVEFEHHMRSERFSPLLEGAMFRICQEAITNATRHSQSPKIQVRLRQIHSMLRLEVSDQGIGFDPNAPQTNSFGLRGIRERARLLGGHAMIDSAPGHGTRIAVELPVTED